LKKMFAYRFMLNCEPPGSLQEGFFEAHHHHHAKRNAQKICRDEVLAAEVRGEWTDWTEDNGIYGCSFMDKQLGRYTFRLICCEVPCTLPAAARAFGVHSGKPAGRYTPRRGASTSLRCVSHSACDSAFTFQLSGNDNGGHLDSSLYLFFSSVQ